MTPDVEAAVPDVVLLPEPCWWIDRNDTWEISHHPTREEAEADHTDRVRSDYGWPLSVVGAFAIIAGTARQEHKRCREWICPDCGCDAHSQERIAACPDACGFTFVIEQVAPDDPAQTRMFEVLPTYERRAGLADQAHLDIAPADDQGAPGCAADKDERRWTTT